MKKEVIRNSQLFLRLKTVFFFAPSDVYTILFNASAMLAALPKKKNSVVPLLQRASVMKNDDRCGSLYVITSMFEHNITTSVSHGSCYVSLEEPFEVNVKLGMILSNWIMDDINLTFFIDYWKIMFEMINSYHAMFGLMC